eukprot:COSAG02_NODE_6133_length_3778_cov_5.507747_3_plen_62_part_00
MTRNFTHGYNNRGAIAFAAYDTRNSAFSLCRATPVWIHWYSGRGEGEACARTRQILLAPGL